MPAGPVCQVTGTICGIDGSAKAGAQVRATVLLTQADQGGQVAGGAGVTSETVSAITADDGTFTIQLLQGATVELEIPDINLRKDVVIPASSTADFVDLV
jgi:hypothetical protein